MERTWRGLLGVDRGCLGRGGRPCHRRSATWCRLDPSRASTAATAATVATAAAARRHHGVEHVVELADLKDHLHRNGSHPANQQSVVKLCGGHELIASGYHGQPFKETYALFVGNLYHIFRVHKVVCRQTRMEGDVTKMVPRIKK